MIQETQLSRTLVYKANRRSCYAGYFARVDIRDNDLSPHDG